MSFTEVKERVAEMSAEERLEVAALIAHLNRADDSEYQVELDGRMSAMDAGRKTSAQTLEKRHTELGKGRSFPATLLWWTIRCWDFSPNTANGNGRNFCVFSNRWPILLIKRANGGRKPNPAVNCR